MRIFKTFIIVLAAVVLFLLPLTGAMYDFKTDLQEDDIAVSTGAGETTANVTLSESIYDDDTTTAGVTSDLSSDSPAFGAYDSTSHSANITGLTASENRTITVTYDIDALEGYDAINTLTDRIPWIWLFIIIAFPAAAIAAIWTGRE